MREESKKRGWGEGGKGGKITFWERGTVKEGGRRDVRQAFNGFGSRHLLCRIDSKHVHEEGPQNS